MRLNKSIQLKFNICGVDIEVEFYLLYKYCIVAGKGGSLHGKRFFFNCKIIYNDIMVIIKIFV